MSQHSERHLQNIASSRERPVTPILDGGWVSKAALMSSDTVIHEKSWKSASRKWGRWLRWLNDWGPYFECLWKRAVSAPPLSTSQYSKGSQGIQKVCFQANRYKSIVLPCVKTQASFIGGLVGGSGSDVAGSKRLNIPQLTHLRALDKSSVQWTQRSLSFARCWNCS